MQISINTDGPLLVFGGPYSNLQAAVAIRKVADRLDIPPSRIICTGDVVAYCAQPEETLQLMRGWDCHTISGNCETSLANRAADCGCGFTEGTTCDMLSKSWYPFADRAISAASRAWMAALPDHLIFTLAGRRVRVIHGGVCDQSRFIFPSTSTAAKVSEFAAASAEIVIAGHCGIPFIEQLDGRLWFNAGVIGMPANDGTRDGWYGLIEQTDKGLTFSLHRLSYDAEQAAGQLRDTGSAPAYAKALLSGLWPSLDILPEAEKTATGTALKERAVTLRNNS